MKKFNLSRRVVAAFKLSSTLLICFFLAWLADWAEILSELRGANPYMLSAVAAAMFLCVIISAAKWKVLLTILGASFRLRELHRYYLIAVFFNNFLPSTIGGDIYRIHKTISNETTRTSAFLAVFIERLTGMWALLVLGLIAAGVLMLKEGGTPIFLKTLTLVFAGGVILPVAGGMFLSRFSSRPAVAAKIPYKLQWVREHLNDFQREKAKAVQVLVFSFFFHLFSFGWMILLFKAIGADFSVYGLAVTAAVSNLTAILPISINGIGLLDGSFTYAAMAFGIEYDRVITFLLLMRGITFLISLVGGLLYLGERGRTDLDELKHGRADVKESTG